MLTAQDKSSVLSWTERQLGGAADRAAVIEISDEVWPEWVEKSGTGVDRAGCEAFISVTADSIQRFAGYDSSEFDSPGGVLTHRLVIKKSSIH